MAKYTESKCRLCRREGAKLFLKGERCFKGVCAFEKRPVAPGQHGMNRKKVSEYPITSWQIDGETMEIVTDFIFLGFKITADGYCS